MNILQLMPEFGIAGAEIMCENLVYQIQKEKSDTVYVVSLYDYHSSITERMERNGVKIFYLHKKRGLDLSVIYKIYRILKKYKIDVVHTHRYLLTYTLPSAIFAHVTKRIHTVHNIAKGEVSRPRRLIHKYYYKCFGVIPVAISPVVRETIVKEYSIPVDSIPIVYNGIDLSKCKQKSSYEIVGDFKIIHVGRLNKVKNQSLLIKAVYNLVKKGYKIKLDLWGNGEEKETYEKLIKQLELDNIVNLRGLTDDIYTQMNHSDALVLPSTYEGMPITLIEAMKTGLPIIASNVGGILDMIENGKTGIIIEPQIDDLEKAICRIITSTELRIQLGMNAYNKANDFSSERMYKNYYSLYLGNYDNTTF